MIDIETTHIAYSIKQGDRQAFSELFDVHYSYLCKVAFTFLNDFDDSEEIVQGSFIKLWENREKIDADQDLKYYLIRIVKNESLNHLKHIKVKLKYADYYEKNSDVLTPDGSDTLIQEELNDKINEIINELPDQCRKIFEMSRFKGLKYKEIAKELSLAEKTVEQQISKALKRLRTGLTNYLPSLTFISIQLNQIFGGGLRMY